MNLCLTRAPALVAAAAILLSLPGCRQKGHDPHGRLPPEACRIAANDLRKRLELNAKVARLRPWVDDDLVPAWSIEPGLVRLPPFNGEPTEVNGLHIATVREDGTTTVDGMPYLRVEDTAAEIALRWRRKLEWMTELEGAPNAAAARSIELVLVEDVRQNPNGFTAAELEQLSAQGPRDRRIVVAADEKAPTGAVVALLRALLTHGVTKPALAVLLEPPPSFDCGTPHPWDAAFVDAYIRAREPLRLPPKAPAEEWLGLGAWDGCARRGEDLSWAAVFEHAPGTLRPLLWAPRAAATFEACGCIPDPDHLVWLAGVRWPPPATTLLPVEFAADGIPLEVDPTLPWSSTLPRVLKAARHGALRLLQP